MATTAIKDRIIVDFAAGPGVSCGFDGVEVDSFWSFGFFPSAVRGALWHTVVIVWCCCQGPLPAGLWGNKRPAGRTRWCASCAWTVTADRVSGWAVLAIFRPRATRDPGRLPDLRGTRRRPVGFR